MRIRPLDDYVIIEAQPDTTERVTASGVHLAANVEAPESHIAEVLAVGRGRWSDTLDDRVPVCVGEGALIVYNRHGGQAITIDGTKYLALRETEIIAIIDQETPDAQETTV